LTVLWRSYDTKGRENVVSIPGLVEENSESLRSRYLEWIYDLGETKIKGKRIVDHLEIRPGLSYWWMTLLAQKCTYSASPNIYHAIRLLACEDLCGSTNVRKIKVVTSNRELASEFRCWCSIQKRECEISILKKCLPISVNWHVIVDRFSKTLAGFCLIVLYFIRRLTLWKTDVTPRGAFNKGIMFFDILTHFDKSAAGIGKFQSNYWTKMPELIKKLGLDANWGHLYYRHHATPNAVEASKVVKGLNKAASGKHFLIDEYFNLWCLAQTLMDFCRLIFKGISFRKLPICFPPNSRFSFRDILRADWQVSLFGKSAASVLCQLNSLESYLSSVPKQRMGIYIQENQPWEIALLHAWRSNRHGIIIGTPHTTIRFWDLRYFYDNRTFKNKDKNTLPTPDKIAVNGPVARAAYNTGLGPIDRLIEVEALRFIETKKYKSRRKCLRTNDSVANRKPVLLVATDLLDTNTTIQLEWVEKAVKANKNNWRIVVRPHPASDFSREEYPRWQESVDRSDLSELLTRVDVIFCSNASSIGVDGCLAGKPIFTIVNGQTFNFSPLRGLDNSTKVSSVEELKAGLSAFAIGKKNKPLDYFFLSKDLQKWKELFSKHSLLAKKVKIAESHICI